MNELSYQELTIGYEKYLAMPLATLDTNPLLYSKMWVTITGMAFMHPHPHEHYTFEKFEDRVKSDKEFREYFMINEK